MSLNSSAGFVTVAVAHAVVAHAGVATFVKAAVFDTLVALPKFVLSNVVNVSACVARGATSSMVHAMSEPITSTVQFGVVPQLAEFSTRVVREGTRSVTTTRPLGASPEFSTVRRYSTGATWPLMRVVPAPGDGWESTTSIDAGKGTAVVVVVVVLVVDVVVDVVVVPEVVDVGSPDPGPGDAAGAHAATRATSTVITAVEHARRDVILRGSFDQTPRWDEFPDGLGVTITEN